MKLLLYYAALLVTVRGKYVKDIIYLEFHKPLDFQFTPRALCIPSRWFHLLNVSLNFLCESTLNRKKLNFQEILKAAFIEEEHFQSVKIGGANCFVPKASIFKTFKRKTIFKFQFPKYQTA